MEGLGTTGLFAEAGCGTENPEAHLHIHLPLLSSTAAPENTVASPPHRKK